MAGYEEVLIRGVGREQCRRSEPVSTDRPKLRRRESRCTLFESTYHQMKAPWRRRLWSPVLNICCSSLRSPALNVGAVRTNLPHSCITTKASTLGGMFRIKVIALRHQLPLILRCTPEDAGCRVRFSIREAQDELLAMRDMLINAGLEHEETLLQLDEMSALAAASATRE